MNSPCLQSCDLVAKMTMIYIRGIVQDVVKLAFVRDHRQPEEVRA